jgi:hypothetical protein
MSRLQNFWPKGFLSNSRDAHLLPPLERSVSTDNTSQFLRPHNLSHSSSTPSLHSMATAVAQPGASRFFHADSEGALNTLPDPRSPSPSTPLSRSDSIVSGQHPDLSNEVATLSTKLVNAINHQTNLDDSLQAARHELEIARQHIAQLEAASKKHQDLISGGLLMKKDDVDNLRREHETEKRQTSKERTDELKQLQKDRDAEKKLLQKERDDERKLTQKELAEERKLCGKFEKDVKNAEKELEKERKLRLAAENERRKMEQELEALTAALFEQANGMVADARRETDAAEKRNEQLKNQLNDAEVLLHSHQEQLQDLKAVVEKISSERDENESNAQMSTAPSTPGMGPHDKMNRIFDASHLTPATPNTDEIVPDQPLKFAHLISPVLRHDLSAYEDFKAMAKAAAKSTPAPSRVASGSYGSINVIGLGLSSGSNKSSHSGSPAAPSFPTVLGNPSNRDSTGSALPALKDTSVYKRALAEDIEPTLRLDVAPGVNWMAKRTIMTSITTGNLVVEPMPSPVSKFRGPIFACALCGENRKNEQYNRRHRFRTSEAEDAQRYPLCDHCLGRVRISCDYIAFLRMIRDGHWRAETDEEIKTAWEESVRLRERMFWQRVGGGVVPNYLQSPTFSKVPGRNSEENLRSPHNNGAEDPFKASNAPNHVSIGATIISPEPESTTDNNVAVTDAHDDKFQDEAEQQLHSEMRSSTGSKSSGSGTIIHDDASPPVAESEFTTPSETPSKEVQRLSLTIPGSFA